MFVKHRPSLWFCVCIFYPFCRRYKIKLCNVFSIILKFPDPNCVVYDPNVLVIRMHLNEFDAWYSEFIFTVSRYAVPSFNNSNDIKFWLLNFYAFSSSKVFLANSLNEGIKPGFQHCHIAIHTFTSSILTSFNSFASVNAGLHLSFRTPNEQKWVFPLNVYACLCVCVSLYVHSCLQIRNIQPTSQPSST